MRHELCRTEAFDEVAKAVAECAFVASDLPVVISMEMHCSPIQQRRVAEVLIQRLGDALLSVRRCTKYSHHKLLAIDRPFDSLLAACAVR